MAWLLGFMGALFLGFALVGVTSGDNTDMGLRVVIAGNTITSALFFIAARLG